MDKKMEKKIEEIENQLLTATDDIFPTDPEPVENKSKYRIRKLTPRECYRLMGVAENQIDKMLAKESNSQNYKAAGNSIVVPVLIALFSQLGIKGCKRWNEMTLDEKKKLIYKGHILENKAS